MTYVHVFLQLLIKASIRPALHGAVKDVSMWSNFVVSRTCTCSNGLLQTSQVYTKCKVSNEDRTHCLYDTWVGQNTSHLSTGAILAQGGVPPGSRWLPREQPSLKGSLLPCATLPATFLHKLLLEQQRDLYMTWDGKQIASLITALAALDQQNGGRPANWNRRLSGYYQAPQGHGGHFLELWHLR
eukprot:2309309-Amphidinium_carterae.2